MDQIHLTYSLKNIPIPPKMSYIKQLVSMIEAVTGRMRWRAIFFLNPQESSDMKENFGFKSTNNPPQVPELKPFEEELASIISNIKYKPASNQFQDQMKEDKAKIARTEEVIVKADKTANLYKMKIEEHRKKMSENITKDYKKANKSKVENVISEAVSSNR